MNKLFNLLMSYKASIGQSDILRSIDEDLKLFENDTKRWVHVSKEQVAYVRNMLYEDYIPWLKRTIGLLWKGRE